MAFWNRKSNKQALQESAHTERQLSLQDLMQLPYYQFAAGLTSLRTGTETITSSIKEAMLNDPIISMIINMWLSDTLHVDIMTGDIFTVEVKKKDDSVKDEAIEEVNDYIEYLLENSNLEEILVQILYHVITDGIVSVKLGFIDTYEDTKIKLFESNARRVESLTETWTDTEKKKLLEAPSYDDYEDELYRQKRTARPKKRALGRYYFEILPARLVPLKHKGITILYLDLKNSVKVLNPRNITTFVNTRGGVKTLSIKDNPDDIMSTTYEIPLGKSFIANSVTPWSMSNTTEDCTLLALMTRSAIYRIFQVDVGGLDTKQTDALLEDLKKRLTTRESIDVRSQHYSSAQTQLPLGDSIFVPVRNGNGSIDVKAIGGDLDIKTQVPLDYFREQLLASLGIPKTLVYGDESGSLINTSATRQDIRYLRMIQQFTSILSLGLESIFKDYLSMIGVDLRKLSLKVKFMHLNSEEALQRIEYEQTKQEALDRMVTSLNNLGINFEDGKYTETRDELIRRFIDDELLDIIKKDEKNMPVIMQRLPEGKGDKEDEHTPLPGGTIDNSDTTFDDMQDEVSPEDTELPDVPEDTGEDTDAGADTNENPPFSIG